MKKSKLIKSPVLSIERKKLLKYNHDIRLSPELTKKLSKSRERSKSKSNKSGSLKRSRALDMKMEQLRGMYQMKEEKVATP